MNRILVRPDETVIRFTKFDPMRIARRLGLIERIMALRSDPDAHHDVSERQSLTAASTWTLGDARSICFVSSSSKKPEGLQLHHKEPGSPLHRFAIVNVGHLETGTRDIARYESEITTTLSTLLSVIDDEETRRRTLSNLKGAALVLEELGLGPHVTVHAPSPWGEAAVFSNGSRLGPSDPYVFRRVRDALQRLTPTVWIHGRDDETTLSAAGVSIGHPEDPPHAPVERLRAIADFAEATGYH